MRLFTLCCVIVIAFAFPEKDLSSGRNYDTEEVQERISGGMEYEEPRQFDYLIQIIREGYTFCTGAIIKEPYMLTAAHCVQDAQPQDLIVLYGSEFRGSGMQIPIEEIVQHPEYDYPHHNYDIAYMKARGPIHWKFPPDRVLTGDPLPRELILPGFGYQGKEDDTFSDVVRFVRLPIISNMQCQMFYPEITITKNMICAHDMRDMSKGACPGDGGAPGNDEFRTRLLGITTYSRGCGPAMGPTVFTFVEAQEIYDFIINGTQRKQSREFSERLAQGKLQILSQEIPERSSDELPEGPTKEKPERPSDEILARSSKELQEGPSKVRPERPSDEITERPFEEIHEGPFEEKPEKPSKGKPERPSEEYSEKTTS